MEIRQYQIILVNLDPTVGREIKKTRPCVVISPKEMNKYLGTLVIAPMTSTLKNYPTRIPVRHQGKEGMVAIDQIRTIDKSRVIKVLGNLTSIEINQIKDKIKETFVD
ncbi:type II toxin-antitoxin system PemK/MazF family toxin [Algoriphagus mannitolivorans]|uniref:type II toxin-antitoxin system PemK/MazF family toxin n=1 Tax=Algoriphagus mannitolivorans TaxID=226504 RepID=UPI0004012AF1|nr:type II toxin-antitoxin system PemK/MazF family toxin [Algoriphagus mannitolivorans]